LALQELERNPEKYQQMKEKAVSIISYIDSYANIEEIVKLVESGDSLFKERKYEEAAKKYAEVWDKSPAQQQESGIYAKSCEGLSYFEASKPSDYDGSDEKAVFDKDSMQKSGSRPI
jgi:hypothetical protein